MKILKELIFSRVKAYNMIQVFHFLSETLESYYCRKLLSISNNRLDTLYLHRSSVSRFTCSQDRKRKYY